jgi:HD-GYP domain-containing protein (c-di-GMP phosphodiesterase class II)
MAVADITASLLETRPYREGMSQDKVRQILHNNVNAGHIDAELTDVAIAHLDEIIELVNTCNQSV